MMVATNKVGASIACHFISDDSSDPDILHFRDAWFAFDVASATDTDTEQEHKTNTCPKDLLVSSKFLNT